MHPRQAKILAGAKKLSEKTATTAPKEAAATILWQYTTPEGEDFWMTSRHMTIRSPMTGKTFTTRPIRVTPGQMAAIVRDMSDPMAADPMSDSPRLASEDRWKE